MQVTEPFTPEEFEKYYLLRWEVLRRPWNMLRGSELDEQEDQCIHAMLKSDDNILAVGRLQFNTPVEGQLRYMAVAPGQQGKGLGSLIIRYLEEKAKQKGAERMVLQARENAVSFYIRNGYSIKEKSFLLWGEIQHYLMEKKL